MRKSQQIIVDRTPMSLAELINDAIEHHDSLAIHGCPEEFEKLLALFPFHYVLKMDELSEEELVNHVHHDSTGRIALPPLWYSELCMFCKNHSEEKCVLLVYGVTRCEWSKQVIMNPVALDHSAHNGAMIKPLPDNSSVIFLVETKDKAQSGYYNLTGQLFDRLSHIYLRDWKPLGGGTVPEAYALYKVDETGLWRKYSVASPHEEARKYRNPYSEVMVQYAYSEGAKLQTILSAQDTQIVIGGSLGYGAAIIGGYDIDMRILFPPTEDAKERLHEASVKLHTLAGFDAGKIVGEARNIYHHYKQVKIDGLPEDADAYLTLNIQIQSEYVGMADIAKLLPETIVERLIVAKGLSAQDGEDAYETVKDHWKSLLRWLAGNGFDKATPEERLALLNRAQGAYPLFLKDGE